LFAASLVVPEVRDFLHLTKDAPANTPAQPLPKPPEDATKRTAPQGQEPVKPTLKLVPLPNAPVPEEKPETLFTRGSGSDIQTQPKPEISSNQEPSLAVPKVGLHSVDVPESVAAVQLIHRVEPSAPPLARQARLEGSVVLQITIGNKGTVETIRVISGHPMLTQAAIDAVKQWRYNPFLENGEPTVVNTKVTVNFSPPAR